MLSNYLAAALRNLARNRLFGGINVVGLAIGFAAVTLIALFIRDELSYDRFWPEHETIYLLSSTFSLPGTEAVTYPSIMADVAPRARGTVPAGTMLARWISRPHVLRRGEIEANEDIQWADPEIFSVLKLPVIAGDLDTALQRPDGVVLTERTARKYFGRTDAIGETLELDRTHLLRVAAIVADPPVNSHLSATIFASGRATFSALSQMDAQPWPPMGISFDTVTYVKVPAGVSVTRVERILQSMSRGYLERATEDAGFGISLKLWPLTAAHLNLPSLTDRPSGNPKVLYVAGVIGLLILTVAGINFVTLMTARASRRATEIGVRKAAGAGSRDLIVQFIGEAVLHAGIAMLLAIALVELLLPQLNAFLQRDIAVRYAHDMGFLLLLAALALITGILAGAYPALVLSRFQPAGVLKGGTTQRAGGASIRQTLVVVQFAVLIGLIFASFVIFRQIDYALNEGLRLDKDQVLVVRTSCLDAFVNEVRKLPGVRAAACSESQPFSTVFRRISVLASNGKSADVLNTAVEPGFFELFGLRPSAGRFFSRQHSADTAPKHGDGSCIGPVILNETAVRKLGFASPAAAVGQTIRRPPGRRAPQPPCEIVGVAPDFPVASIHEAIQPMVFHTDTRGLNLLSIKLSGRQIPETLTAIDRLWRQVGEPRPIQRFFADQYVQDQYLGDLRQGTMIAAFATVAVFIACLGLFGLSAFTAERRTKEIGVRKAIGASRIDILRMLLWQFTRPVLWAQLIAWPLGYYLMSRWLQGFAYRTQIAPWMFLAAGGIALLIALLTVSTHALIVARAKPISALRYE